MTTKTTIPNNLADIYNAIRRNAGRYSTLIISPDAIYAHADSYATVKVGFETGVSEAIIIQNPRILKASERLFVDESGELMLQSAGATIPVLSAMEAAKASESHFPVPSCEVPFSDPQFKTIVTTRALQSVSLAAATEDVRDLMYMYIAIDALGVTVATDGIRLAVYQPKGVQTSKPEGVGYVPPFAAKLAAVFGAQDLEITRFTDGTLAKFDNVEIRTTLLENFRDYTQIEAGFVDGISYRLSADELLFAKEIAALAKADKVRKGRFGDDAATLYFRAGAMGCKAPNLDTTTEYPSGYAAEFEIRLNPALFLDGALATGMLPTLTVQALNKPVKLTVDGSDYGSGTFSYYLMPIRY